MQKTQNDNDKCAFLTALLSLEDLAEKKTKIYSRLLTDAALAKDMESLAERHASRKAAIESLLGGKVQKQNKKSEGEE